MSFDDHDPQDPSHADPHMGGPGVGAQAVGGVRGQVQPQGTQEESPGGGGLYFLLEAWITLSKYRRRLVLMLFGWAVVCLWIYPSLPRAYSSRAVIQIRKSLATAAVEDLGLKPTEAAGQISEDYREVQMGLLEGRQLSERVAQSLLESGALAPSSSLRTRVRSILLELVSNGAQEAYVDQAVLNARRLEDGAAFVSQGLSVRRGLKSPKIELEFSDGDPGRAQQVLSLLLEGYREELAHIYDIKPVLERARENIASARGDWVRARNALEEFRIEHGLHDMTTQLTEARGALTTALNSHAGATVSIGRAKERVTFLEEAHGAMPESFPSSPARTANRYRWVLFDLLEGARRRVVESPFVPGSPEFEALQVPVDELSAELNELPSEFLDENPPLPNASFFKLESDLAFARAELAGGEQALEVFSRGIDTARAEIERVASLSGELEQLDVDEGLAREQLDARTDHLAHIERIADMGEAELLWSYKIIQAPTRPGLPSSPSRLLQLAVLLAAGSGLVTLVTLILGVLDRSIRSPSEIERDLGVGPLCTIPDLSNRKEVVRLLRRLGGRGSKRSQARQFAKNYQAVDLFSELGPHSVLIESRLDGMLRTLDESETAAGSGATVLAVTAAHARAGATTIAANLASRLSVRRGCKVLFVRRGAADAGTRPQSSQLDVLSYESELDGLTIGEWLGDMVESYSHVVFDAPPVLRERETLRMVSDSDLCLLVARAHISQRSSVIEATTALGNHTGARIGLVLNAQKSYCPGVLEAA